MKNIGVGEVKQEPSEDSTTLLQDADLRVLIIGGLAKIRRCKGSATMKRRGFWEEKSTPRKANSHIFHVRANLFRIDPWGRFFPRGAGSRNSAEGGKRDQCE